MRCVNRLLDTRGQSFIEFCLISAAIIVAVAALTPSIGAKASAVISSFLDQIPD